MKRCIFEYNLKSSAIRKEQGKQFILDLFIAANIEKEIEATIKGSVKNPSKVSYSQKLTNAITQMYEVISLN